MNEEIQRALEVMSTRGADPGAATVWQHAVESSVDERTHRRRVRRRSITSGIAAVTVVAIVATVIALTNNASKPAVVRVTPTTNGHAAPPAVATADAAQLASGKWSTLPPAPIPTRARATVVWTGHELIVWGGATDRNQDQLRADGAAYDPATNAWRILPTAPLSPRLGQAVVWTGTDMIIWGGNDDASNTKPHATSDGAAYNPTTNSWTRLSASPLAARTQAIAVWTGDEMIVLGGQPAIVTDAEPDFTDGAAYDPAKNDWHKLPLPEPPAHHQLTWDTAAQAGPNQLLAWSQWALSRRTGPNSAELSGGADLFRFDESSRRWTNVAAAANALPSVEEAIWNGEQAIVRGDTVNCGACSRPFIPEATALYDPATNSWTRLLPDPLSSDHMTSTWTGGALFSFNAGSQSGSIVPGDATVYDPAAKTWAQLKRAPSGCDDSPTPIWTGRAVLMYCPNAATDVGGLAYVPSVSTPPITPAAPTTATAPASVLGAIVPGTTGGRPPCASGVTGDYGGDAQHPERAPLRKDATFNSRDRWAMCGASVAFSSELLNLRSTDDGATWNVTVTPIAFSPHNAGDDIEITFTNETTGRVTITSLVAPSLAATYETHDGGRTWTRQ